MESVAHSPGSPWQGFLARRLADGAARHRRRVLRWR